MKSASSPDGQGAFSYQNRSKSLMDSTWMYRLGVASRAVAAIVGGYALSSLVATVMALYLPGARVEATLAGMLASFVVYTAAVMWVFAVRTAWRAWLGLLIASAPLAIALLVHVHAGSGT